MVEVSGLEKVFREDADEVVVLRDLSMRIDAGEMVSLVGVSGAGKTTLLQILGGLDTPSGGSVTVDGRELSRLNRRALAHYRSRSVGFVFQLHHLLPDFTALENVFMPGLIIGTPRTECIQRSQELLEAVGLKDRMNHFPNELSGGERQRAALARALFNRPAIVLADEPTGSLDRKNGALLLDLFTRMNEQYNQTFIVATHNAQLSQGLRRTLYLEEGRIVERSAAELEAT
jgi:lipoprotein-releasing system ATP-binding protein